MKKRFGGFNKIYAMQLATIFLGFIVFGISENIKGPAIPRIQFDFNLDEKQLGTLFIPKCIRLFDRLLLYSCIGSEVGDQGCQYYCFCIHDILRSVNLYLPQLSLLLSFLFPDVHRKRNARDWSCHFGSTHLRKKYRDDDELIPFFLRI